MVNKTCSLTTGQSETFEPLDEPIFSLTVPAKFQAYLASGKPIYCVMKGEVADLVTNNKIGFVAHPNNDGFVKSLNSNFICL